MARRKPKGDDQLVDAVVPLMLPPPSPAKRGHGHDADPYESLPGAVPHIISQEPLRRKMTSAEVAQRAEAQKDAKMRGARFSHYLDKLADQGGNQEQALAVIFGVSVEEARMRRAELLLEVRSGIGTSSLADILERNDLDVAARANMLRKHAYSPNPAASLKAIQMAGEMEGERGEVGNFESFLRLVKSTK